MTAAILAQLALVPFRTLCAKQRPPKKKHFTFVIRTQRGITTWSSSKSHNQNGSDETYAFPAIDEYSNLQVVQICNSAETKQITKFLERNSNNLHGVTENSNTYGGSAEKVHYNKEI